MVATTGFSFLLSLILAGQMGVPLGLPPLPEDPAMAAVAPEECLWYFTWSGVKAADAKSKNQTEQLLAEPEVKQFIDSVGAAFSAAIKKGAPPTPQGKLLGQEGPKLIYALVTHPAAMFISAVAMGPTGPDVHGGVVIGTGDDTAAIKSTLEQIEKIVLGVTAKGDAKWHKLPPQPGVPPIEWGFSGKYLIVGIGAGSADAIVERFSGKAPAWLTEIRRKLPVERVSTVHFINLKKGLAIAKPFIPEADVAPILDTLGLSKAETIASVSGLEGTGCTSKVWVKIDPAAKGLPAIFSGEPLTAADLAAVPKDASCAFVARLRLDRLMTDLKPLLSDDQIGFHLSAEVLATLGDTWSVYNSPREGGLIFTGLTLVVPLKDRDALVRINDRLVKQMRDKAAAAPKENGMFGQQQTDVREMKFADQKIFFASTMGGFISSPFAPAWSITEKNLVVSLSPQSIKAYLSRDRRGNTLADVPAVAAQLKTSTPLLVTYQDTASTLKIVYPIVQIFATMFSSSSEQNGINLDAAMLPSLSALLPHIEPSVGILSRDKDGFVYVSRQTFPGVGVTSALLPLGMWFWAGDFGPLPVAEPMPVSETIQPEAPTEPKSAEPKLESSKTETPRVDVAPRARK